MQIAGGALAAAWLGSLWYASGLIGDKEDPASGVRGVLVLGVLLPLALGFAHLLYAPVLFVVVLALCAVRYRRDVLVGTPVRRRGSPLAAWQERAGVAIVVFAVAAAAWPALARPVLEGDSLWYHLPNAAAWAQTGSIWQTGTRYWWYPGGSELFASGLFAVSGPFSVGLAGTAALLFAGLRIYAWALREKTPALAAGALGAATVATATFGLQGGNLQNDVWLGAFFLELLWDARFAPRQLGVDGAVCALIKPYGFAFAAYGLVAARRFDSRLLIPIVVFGAWVARDLILLPHALIAPQTTEFPNTFNTTIVANAWPALGALGTALWHDGIWMIVLVAAPILGSFAARDRWLSIAGVVSLVVYPFMPFSYRSYVDQLANGHSLRYITPALAVGAVVSAELLRGAWRVAAPLLLIATALELNHIAGIFWIDPHAHWLIAVAAGLVLPIALLEGRQRAVVVSAVAVFAVMLAHSFAATDTPARYDELLQPEKTRAYDWIARNHPARLVSSDVPAGAAIAVSPGTRAFDVLDAMPCTQARRLGALLLVRRRPPSTKTFYPLAAAEIARCGTTLYADDALRIIRPIAGTRPPRR